MLPVCSATPSSCSHSQISFPGGSQSVFGYRKPFEISYLANSTLFTSTPNGTHYSEISCKPLVVKGVHSESFVRTGQLDSVDAIHSRICPDVIDCLQDSGTYDWSASAQTVSDLNPIHGSYMHYIGNIAASNVEKSSAELMDRLTDIIPGDAEPGCVSAVDDVVSHNSVSLPDSASIVSDSPSDFRTNLDNITSVLNEPVDTPTIDVPDNPFPLSDSFSVDSDSLSNFRLNTDEVTTGLNEPIATKVAEAKSNITSSVDAITSSLQGAIMKANDAIDNVIRKFSLTIDQTGESAGSKLENFWGDLKQAAGRARVAAADVLRYAIVSVEDSLSSGASLVSYSYGSAKVLLPPEIRDALNLSEETALRILVPVGSALQQVSVFVVELERKIGLDPDDPIVPFVIFLGTSASLWIFYQRQIYGGYAGDLSPKETLELLMGKENALLIDVRPEELRERDGIPDLRRGARFRYASVDLPEFDSSVKKLLKSGRDLDDALIAVIIRNLKIVQGKSKVVIMDADGSRSKGIARALRKLGIKGSFLMEGGFRSWVKQGLRVKELKPETTLTILNEEVEAILEEINPTPIQVLGSGLSGRKHCS
uniref:Rhodanese domain-containing protein n=1 Tax=Kalanchoe fedtschenkoi TaxID=63787 RepID=A0A7N0TV72_KALFE